MQHFVLILSYVSAFAIGRRYDGYKIVEIATETPEHRSILRNAVNQRQFDVQYWSEHGRQKKSVYMLVAPEHHSPLSRHFERNGIDVKTLHSNVQELFDKEQHSTTPRKRLKRGMSAAEFELNKYHSWQEMQDWIKALSSQNLSFVSTFDVGKSTENRNVLGIKIGMPNGQKKKSIWIDAGIHAREWIADAVGLYIIAQLIHKYDSDMNIQYLVNNLDWFIVVAPNPDGYEYSRTSDRMWRKTRSKHGPCYGVDPNRNFNFHWNRSEGSSADCNSEFYAGPKAFSEPETKNMANWILYLTRKRNLQAMITLHSYSQLWLIPYGYTSPPFYPPDYNELLHVAQEGAAAVKAVHGTDYTVENAAELYPAAGASDDWSKGIAKVKYVYTIELRPTENDFNGFVLPEDQIIPTAEEIWAGIQVIAKRVLNIRNS